MKEIYKGYLRKQGRYLGLFAVLLCIVFGVYGLYGLPWGPVIYSVYIAASVFVLFMVLDFYGYYKQVQQLQAVRKQAARHLQQLPPPQGLLEQQYHAIIGALDTRCLQAEEAVRQNAAEAKQYYTLWSHQIKTPIAAMRLLLQEASPDSDALERELLKIEQYVEMVLQYQRLDMHTNDLVLQEHSLDALLNQALRRVSSLFIHKKIGVRVEPLGGYRVLTDEKWMVFVLEQLLTNAVKYTPKGMVSIRLSQDSPHTLIIQDTGIGILPEDLPRVFEWGYTGYNGRADKRATGIGLSLCKQALDLLGHSIRIESAVGVGTTVFLNLARPRFDIE